MRGEGYSLSDIAAATGNNNSGFGNNGDWAWIIVLFLIFGWGRNGFGGGFGGNSGTSVYEGYVLNNDFSQLSRQISDSTAMTERKLDGITNGLCTLGYDNLVQTNTVNANINTLGTNLQACCCDLKGLIADNKYETAKGFCSVNNTIALSTRDIVDNMNANYRALHDEIVANRIEDKNAQITALQTRLNNAELRASQEAQSAYILNELKPCGKPAYIVPNPNCCYNYQVTQGCGCGC